MRRTILASLLLAAAASPAAADPWQLTNDRILGDPAFLPLAGEVEGSFQYSYEALTYDSDDGVPPTSADRSTNAFTPFLSYGVTDRLSASVQLPFGNERVTGRVTNIELTPFLTPFGMLDYDVVPIAVRQRYSRRSIGAQDPTFQLVWRAVEQGAAPLNLDLAAFWMPDVFEGRTSDGQVGSIAPGGQSGGFQAAASRQMQALTVRVYAGLALVGRQRLNDDPLLRSVDYGGRLAYAAGFETETRIAPWLAVNAGVQAQISSTFDQTVVTRDAVLPPMRSSVRVSPGGQIAPYVGVVIPALGGRVAGELVWQHGFIGDQTERSPFGGTKFFGQGSNVYAARLLFRFQAL